jgi:hypothetical protein
MTIDLRLVVPFAFVTLATAGCSATSGTGTSSGTGVAPIMDGISFPATCSIGSDGTYDLAGTISFHSTDSTISTIDISSPALASDTDLSVEPVAKVVSGPVTIQFPASNASGTATTYSISVIDANGNQSAPISGSVTLL